MPTLSPAATATRTLARVAKAGASLLVLTVATAGLPLLLAWATPTIWAATHDDLTHLLDRQDSGGAFLLLLIAVGWMGWAQFAFCTVRELIAQLRGRTWHAPRGMGASQRAAALLIGSILVLLPTSSALASDAQAAPATTAARVPGQAQAPKPAETEQAARSSASTAASRPSYTVRQTRPAQSLWAIAERELGDGERWREIAALNEGHTMADGSVFRANSFLQPGWQLQMPDPSTAAGGLRTQLDEGTPAGDEESAHTVTVHPGDYLSRIAEEELGDGGEWPELFKASQGQKQPHGLPPITDPDLIRPGQQITVPGARPGRSDQPPHDRGHNDDAHKQETTPPDSQKPDSEHQPGEVAGGDQTPAPNRTTTPAPRPSAPSTPSSRPTKQPGQHQASPSATAPAAPEPSISARPSTAAPTPSAEASGSAAASSPAAAASDTSKTAPAGSPLNLRTVLGTGALLAAAITGALALRRTLQRRRRKPGEKIAIPPETSTAEAQLAAAAEPDGAARLDVALRTLAHQAAAQDKDAVLPPLRAARIGTRTVEVLPEDPTAGPAAPFISGQGGWWTVPADADLLDEDDARKVPAPYPGLVTIGSTTTGDLLLLNLARLPALLLDGNPVHITEVCTSLALELAMSPWAGDIEVVTVGFGEDLPQLLPTARIAHMRQPAHALRDLSERLLEAHQMPETEHQPYLLLCAATLAADTAWQFADVIDKAGTIPVTLIAPVSTAAAHFPEAEILNASLTEPQTLGHAGTDITVQRLQHAAYEQITTALKVSGQPAHPAEGPWQDVPDEPDHMQQPEQAAPRKPDASTATGVPSVLLAAPSDAGSNVFPALLAACADPTDLRLLPTMPSTSASDAPDASPETAPPAAAKTTAGDETPQTRTPEASHGEREVSQGDEYVAQDLHAPEIRVLGPVEVTGVDRTGHGPRMAQLAALLYFRPGRRADVLCSDMDPVSPWSTSTLNARLQGLRRSLGNDPAGNPYVPRRSSGEDPYRLAPAADSSPRRPPPLPRARPAHRAQAVRAIGARCRSRAARGHRAHAVRRPGAIPSAHAVRQAGTIPGTARARGAFTARNPQPPHPGEPRTPPHTRPGRRPTTADRASRALTDAAGDAGQAAEAASPGQAAETHRSGPLLPRLDELPNRTRTRTQPRTAISPSRGAGTLRTGRQPPQPSQPPPPLPTLAPLQHMGHTPATPRHTLR